MQSTFKPRVWNLMHNILPKEAHSRRRLSHPYLAFHGGQPNGCKAAPGPQAFELQHIASDRTPPAVPVGTLNVVVMAGKSRLGTSCATQEMREHCSKARADHVYDKPTELDCFLAYCQSLCSR